MHPSIHPSIHPSTQRLRTFFVLVTLQSTGTTYQFLFFFFFFSFYSYKKFSFWKRDGNKSNSGTPPCTVLPFIVLGRYCVIYKLTVCDSSALTSLFEPFFPTALAHFTSLCPILVILAIFQAFSLLLYLLRWSVIGNPWHYLCNCFGVPRTLSSHFKRLSRPPQPSGTTTLISQQLSNQGKTPRQQKRLCLVEGSGDG